MHDSNESAAGRLVSHIQGSDSSDIPLDKLLSCLHLREERRIADNPCRVLNLPARLI